jgi:hypothetical protein
MALIASVLGALLVLTGIVAAILGSIAIFIPQLIVGGLLLLIGLAIERWRYKPIVRQPPAPDWTDTGERFVDPETNGLTAVYLDANGERHYIAVER